MTKSRFCTLTLGYNLLSLASPPKSTLINSIHSLTYRASLGLHGWTWFRENGGWIMWVDKGGWLDSLVLHHHPCWSGGGDAWCHSFLPSPLLSSLPPSPLSSSPSDSTPCLMMSGGMHVVLVAGWNAVDGWACPWCVSYLTTIITPPVILTPIQ